MKRTALFKMNRLPTAVMLAVIASSTVMAADTAVQDSHKAQWARPVKAMVISMFAPESEPWIKQLSLNQEIRVPGLSPDYPVVRCNRSRVCNVVTGMGYANAAATMTALIHSGKFDLRRTYFLVAGIAGIDPAQGTLGSAAWTRYLVDFGIAWEIDSREMPAGWNYGYFGIATKGPWEKPKSDYRTEVFQLNERLLQKAISLSKNVQLDDSNEAKAFRSQYAYAPANQPPAVIQCDTASSGTWFAGESLGKRARDWVALMTDGKGTYCTTQQEDNATYEALKRGAAAGKLDLDRVAVLRTGADFDRPHSRQTNAEGLLNYVEQGGFVPAVNNLYKAGGPLINEIVGNWRHWKHGVPK